MPEDTSLADAEIRRQQEEFIRKTNEQFGMKGGKIKPTPNMAPPPTQEQLGRQNKMAEILRLRMQREGQN